MAEQEEPGFWSHVEDLRRMLLRAAVAVLALAVGLFAAMPWIFDHVISAPCRGDFILYRWLAMARISGGAFMPDLGDPGFSVQLINIELATQFFTHMSLSCYLALILATPYLLFEVWRFVSPALYEKEKRGARAAFAAGCLLFYLGMAVGYLIVFPLTLRFLADYELSSMIASTVSLTSYMDSFYVIVLIMGAVFEVPVVAWLLGRIGLLRRSFFSKYRRHAIVAILIVAALLTPTGDPFSLTVIFLPIYALWEASALLVPKGDKEKCAMKFFKKLGLLPYIIVAICLGLLCGWGCAHVPSMAWAVRLCATFNAIFSQYLGFIIPLLILGFVAPAIAELGAKAGKMLLFTVALAYAFTLMAGFISYGVSSLTFSHMISPMDGPAAVEATAATAPFFTIAIPPLMDVVSALALAFILGLGTARVGSQALFGVLSGLRDAIQWAIAKSIIPLLPVYIFTIFVDMSYKGEAWPMLAAFGKVIGIIFAMHIGILVLHYCISGAVAKANPFKSLWIMMPAYFTALGTSSSAATIPVTLRRAQLLGVSPEVAGFTVPLCATIHMSGSTLKIVACAMALMIMQGHSYGIGMFAQFIAMLGISIIAAPGVPGGAIMASLGILSSILGFSQADCALMIALYIAMDSFGTACNVTGDGAIAQIVNRVFPAKPGA